MIYVVDCTKLSIEISANPNTTPRLNFPQNFHYQLAAMQAQAKVQQNAPANHAQLLQQMQVAQEQTNAIARAQVETQAQLACARAEAQARVQAHAQAQARAQAQAEAQANQAQAFQQSQQQAAALAQQRSLISGAVTTAHEYYYAHAQRTATNLPEYLARLAAQQHTNTVPQPTKGQPSLFVPTSEQMRLHQQQIFQNNATLQQQQQIHSQQQQIQLAAAAAAVAAASTSQRQQESSSINSIPQRLSILNTTNPQLSPQLSHSSTQYTSLPSTSTTSNNSVVANVHCNPAMGPHEDKRYHDFLVSVIQLEKQIAENLATAAVNLMSEKNTQVQSSSSTSSTIHPSSIPSSSSENVPQHHSLLQSKIQ